MFRLYGLVSLLMPLLAFVNHNIAIQFSLVEIYHEHHVWRLNEMIIRTLEVATGMADSKPNRKERNNTDKRVPGLVLWWLAYK